MVKLTQGQHHVVFGTRWELNPGRRIRILHRVPLHHGPIGKKLNFKLTDLFNKNAIQIINKTTSA